MPYITLMQRHLQDARCLYTCYPERLKCETQSKEDSNANVKISPTINISCPMYISKASLIKRTVDAIGLADVTSFIFGRVI